MRSISVDPHFKNPHHPFGREQFFSSAAEHPAMVKPDDLLGVIAHQDIVVRDEQDRDVSFLDDS